MRCRCCCCTTPCKLKVDQQREQGEAYCLTLAGVEKQQQAATDFLILYAQEGGQSCNAAARLAAHVVPLAGQAEAL